MRNPSFGTLKVGAPNTQSPRRKTGKRHFPGWIELEEEEVSSIRDEKEYNLKLQIIMPVVVDRNF
jgi:hypothetical protein